MNWKGIGFINIASKCQKVQKSIRWDLNFGKNEGIKKDC